jgi:Endopolygalacturonase
MISLPLPSLHGVNLRSLLRRAFALRAAVLAISLVGILPAFARAEMDVISVVDYGAVGNGVADDSTAIQNAINDAVLFRKSVFLPGGTYLINTRIDLGSTTLTGEGTTVEGGTARSLLKAGTAGMTMLACGSKSQVRNIGLQGANLANIGIRLDGVRISLSDIEVFRCRKTAYLLPSTQNSTLTNCYSTYSVTAFTLANGARNNNFYNCTANNKPEYYNATAIGVPYADTRLLYFVIDTADPDYGSFVTYKGNDRNNWFGGIFERSPCAIVFENLSGYTDNEATTNQFYGVELSSSMILDTTNSLTPGVLTLDSCSVGWKDQDSPFGVGTTGFVKFQGTCYFTGGNNLDNRGITQASNYPAQFIIDTDSVLQVSVYRGGNLTTDTATKSVTIHGGDATVGARFSAISHGNLVNSATARRVGRPVGFNALLTYTVTQITGSNPVLIILELDQSPNRRTIATATAPGTYSVPVRIGEHPGDTFSVIVSANNNTSCTIKGVSLRAVGMP